MNGKMRGILNQRESRPGWAGSEFITQLAQGIGRDGEQNVPVFVAVIPPELSPVSDQLSEE